jgi:toxin YhaV
MSTKQSGPLIIHGWAVFAHALFLGQLNALAQQVELLKSEDSVGYTKKNASKRLAAIIKLAFDVIPQDPTRLEYRQGNTIGNNYKHWFRAKFFQQYRLFFRYHLPSKVIVLAWVNGQPPDNWDQLLKDSIAAQAEGKSINMLDQEALRMWSHYD